MIVPFLGSINYVFGIYLIKPRRQMPIGNGTYRARTYDPLLVRQMLSQLS